VDNCPVVYPDVFNQEISNNKAIHIHFAQAIPLVTYIDESCIYLKEKKCGICKTVCKNDAIDFSQTAKRIEVKVGAVILAPGLEPFDPRVGNEYGYGKLGNVVTSMDYERLMCATGPYDGEILRASDKNHPHKIAWIQCVGSRQVNPAGGNSYCSAVCCTYTQKQLILTKDHNPEAECTVFHNDIRAHGKDFERFFQRAEALPETRFIRSYVSIAGEDPETKNVAIRYATPKGEVKEETFDMVVLSVGFNPPTDASSLASKFGFELNPQGFCQAPPFNPVETTRQGIFLSGGFQGPVDIPESVFSASAAGSKAGQLLNYRRGKLARDRVYPAEVDVSQEEPKIGVFVCHCGANIGRVVDVPSAVEYAKTLPNVVYAQEQLFSCAANCAQEITDLTQEMGLNRVIIAACSPRTLDALFRDTVREAGLNQYYYDMANIREHCSWVHAKEKEKATVKAKDIIRMSVARTAHLEPLQEMDLPVNKAALVVGGGIAGMTCALSIAEQGHVVHLVEREEELGGKASKIYHTLEGHDIKAFVHDLVRQVYLNPLVHVYTDAVITEATGYIGNFVTTVRSERGISELKHGATVVAVGADVYQPTEYLYGEDNRVLTHLELEDQIHQGDEKVVNANSLVMIQCVGSRNEERNYCSRICCNESVKNALALKEINPEMDIYILYRDMRTYGYGEDYYREAADKGVKFIRYEQQEPPQVKAGQADGGRPVLQVTVPDYILDKVLEIDADIVALAAAIIPPAGKTELSKLFKVALSPDQFFQEAHVKLKPLEFATGGVYLCGMAHYPKLINETLEQAYGAAGRALTVLSHDTVTASGSVCEVVEKSCIGCGECVTACTYGAIQLNKTRKGNKAVVNPVLCKGDGLCCSKCPTSAIQLKHFTDDEIEAQIDALVETEKSSALEMAV
jgi:heterodisulfide reductase subunit A